MATDGSGDPFDNFETELLKAIEESEQRSRESDKKEPKLLIDKIRIRSPKDEQKSIKFDSIENVYDFWIGADQNYDKSKCLPKLVLPESLKELNIDLQIGFEDCLNANHIIEDYDQYRDNKWEYFLKTIKDNDLIGKCKPQFVSFGGPIGDILVTPNDPNYWKIEAQKTNDVIYLFKSRRERMRSYYDTKRINRQTYSSLKFLHLVTDRDDKELNEFEKCFTINCISYDSHKILSLNELDAINNTEPVDIKLVKKRTTARDETYFYKTRLLRIWSKATVQGSKQLLIGNTDHDNNLLIDIQQIIVDQIPEICGYRWSDTECLAFLNRFLTFIKNCVSEENIVYEFEHNSGEEFVVCNRINPTRKITILPEDYTKA